MSALSQDNKGDSTDESVQISNALTQGEGIGSGAMPGTQVLRPRPGAAVVECTGEQDISNAPALDALLKDLAGENDLVVVDISEAEFIDSSIIHCLVKAHRRSRDKRTQFRLQYGTALIVEKALELSGVLELLDVAESREEALAPRMED
jgi:anti-sigma B factor antagonist